MNLPDFLKELGFTCWAHVALQVGMVSVMAGFLVVMIRDAVGAYREYKSMKQRMRK